MEVYAEAESQHTSLGEVLRETLVRPTRMLVTEAVVLFFGLWSAFCIGIAFMFTQSLVQVYSELYGWTFFGTGLVQSAVVIGELLGLVSDAPEAIEFLITIGYHWIIPSCGSLVIIGQTTFADFKAPCPGLFSISR